MDNVKRTAKNYIRSLLDEAHTKGETTQFNFARNSIKQSKLNKLMCDVLGSGQVFDPLFQNGSVKEQTEILINSLCSDLKLDLSERVSEQYQSLVNNTEIGLLPLMDQCAYCLAQTDDNKTHNSYYIILHEYVYILILFLSKSIVLENVEGSLSQFKACGFQSFKQASCLFSKTSNFDIKNINFDNINNIDVVAELTACQHNLATITLKFIVLHEFAHIAHKDLNVMDSHKRFLISESESTSEQYWDSEFKADAFALHYLCSTCVTPISAWANFTQVYMFFSLLAFLETKSGFRSANTHPPAKIRVEKMLTWMKENIGSYDESSNNIHWVDSKVAQWISMLD
ncbi:hypothetical protein [Pseudoalteromonas denitrificans]|uniref:Peptidase U49 n=1 Tax=Pseudoalteromonas denitrificans DSM 6059 TaxID=1123010 RepID=A0A1I1RK19_9GAMM|nr:hypothetical protein [Pseudoalteromonas denitrificans]SFD34666.1 Peptidase U49 [Pseudoalteromonas denitrificans DSM 6059]